MPLREKSVQAGTEVRTVIVLTHAPAEPLARLDSGNDFFFSPGNLVFNVLNRMRRGP